MCRSIKMEIMPALSSAIRPNPARRGVAVLCAVFLVLVPIAGPVSAASTVEGTPSLSASAPDARFDPGESGALTLSITNDARYADDNETHPAEALDRAGEARSVDVSVASGDAPLTVETGEQSIGTIEDGETATATAQVAVDEDAPAGTYDLEVTTTYRHAAAVTYDQVADGEYAYEETRENRTETTTVTVTVEPTSTFAVTDLEHDVPLGGEGTVALEVTNTGEQAVSEAAVTLAAGDADLTVGSGGASSTASVGEWAPGTTERLVFRARTADAAVQREYPLEVTVEYDDNGTAESADHSAALTPRNRTAFAIENVTDDVPVDGEGTLSVAMTNVEERALEDVSITASAADPSVSVVATTARVGEWSAGATERLAFRVQTTGDAVTRPTPIELSISYTDADDNDNDRTRYVSVTPADRSRFAVSIADHDVPQNGEGTITLAVENTLADPAEDVRVTAGSEAGAVSVGGDSASAESVVESWAGEETRTITVRAFTTDGAIDRDYPLTVETSYSDAEGNDNVETATLAFRPGDREQFAVEAVDHDLPRGGEGTVRIDLRQTTGDRIEDVTVTASSTDSDLTLGGSASATAGIDRWADDAVETVRYRASTTDDAVARPYSVDLEIAYTDADDARQTRTVTVTVRPDDADRVAVSANDSQVPLDGVGTATLTVRNVAGRDLSDVSVTATTPSSAVTIGGENSRRGTAAIGDLDEEAETAVTFRVGTTGDAVDRRYPLDVEITSTDDDGDENTHTERIAFRPDAEPQFAVQSIDHDVPVGGSGRVTVTLQNRGPVDASEATVTVSAESDAMYLGTGGGDAVEVEGVAVDPPEQGSPAASAYVGEWPVGENRTLTLRAGFDEQAIQRPYVASLAVAFENPDGETMPERTRSVGIEPVAEQSFSYGLEASDLHVGEAGDLVVNVTNAVDRPVEGAVVTAAVQDDAINLYNARHAVGRLGPGETATARFRVGVTEAAEPGPRLFELASRYRGARGEVRRADARDLRVEIGPERRAIAVETENRTVQPGETGPLAVTITNQREEPLTDIQARLYTDSPLDSDDDSAFVTRLEPGASRTLDLAVSVDDSAREKLYAASMDVRYDVDGETHLSKTARIPVRVGESGGGIGLPALAVPLSGLAALAVAWISRSAWLDRVR